jgi:hypothetical protein
MQEETKTIGLRKSIERIKNKGPVNREQRLALLKRQAQELEFLSMETTRPDPGK